MKKAIVGLLLLCGIFLGYWQLINTPPENREEGAVTDKPVVKIGVVTQLSGNMSMVGEGIKNAVILAKEDLAKRDLKNEYQFVIEDDAYEARKTAMIFPKLKDLDKVDAILSSFSQTGKIIAPQAEAAKILHIGIASDEIIAAGKYNFIDWTVPSKTAQRILDFYKSRGFKKIVSIVPNNAGALPLKKAFMDRLKPEDGIEVSTHLVAPEEKDFKMLLAQTREEKADAYLALLYGASFATFFKQYQEAGETAVITSIETFAVLPDFSIANGAYFTDAAEADSKFMEKYQRKFSKSSAYAAGNMYDMVLLTVEAFEKAPDKKQAVDELAKIKTYDGTVGRLTQDEKGVFNSEAVLKHIENGRPVIVEN